MSRVTMLSSLVYGRDLVMRSLTMVLVLFVFVQLWRFTYAEQGAAAIEGFTLTDMIWYLVITETVALSAPRVSLKIDEEVKSGALAYVLAKPYNYVLYHLSGYWGEGVLRLPFNFAAGGTLALVMVGAPQASAVVFLAAGAAIILGMTINFLVEASIGLSAFWFEDSQPFFWVYQKLVFTIGGLFIPITLLPAALREIAGVLPFAAIAYTPGSLFADFSWDTALHGFGLQAAWLLVASGAAYLVYAKAVRKLNVHGG